MVRAERLYREAEIAPEIETSNELLGGPGELGCSLLIGIPDAAERDQKLRRWLPLLEHLYLGTASGRTVRPSYDPRQVGEGRLSSVQYLRFPVGADEPAAVGCDLPELRGETALPPAQRQALLGDLGR
jgi:hypothetical protein